MLEFSLDKQFLRKYKDYFVWLWAFNDINKKIREILIKKKNNSIQINLFLYNS